MTLEVIAKLPILVISAKILTGMTNGFVIASLN
jgi:hypothetical protein